MLDSAAHFPTERTNTTATATALRRSKRLRLKRMEPAILVKKHQHKTTPSLPLRRSERLANKKLKKTGASRVKIASELRRSQRLAEKRLRKAQGQLPGSPQPLMLQPKNSSITLSPGSKHVRQLPARARLFPYIPCEGMVSFGLAIATERQVQIPAALLQTEANCSDNEWLWLRWNGVPTENRVSWDHVLTRRGKFLQLACASRDVSLVKTVYAISQLPQYRDNDKWRFVDAVHYAVEYQLYKLLPWLSSIDQVSEVTQPTSSLLMNMALSNGDLRIAQWLYENRPSVQTEQFLQSTTQMLGRHSLELLRWVIAHYPTVFSSASATPQQPEGLESIIRRFQRGDPLQSAGDEAVASGNLSVVRFLYENCLETTVSTQALSTAAAHGHLEVLQFLHDQNLGDWTTAVMNKAAAHGNLAIVMFLQANRAEGCTQQAMDRAARNGHLRVLEFLQSERTEGFSESALVGAAANGHLKVIKFLNAEYERYYNSVLFRAMTEAAKNNRLEVLKLLLENYQKTSTVGACVMERLKQQAAMRKSEAVVQLLSAKLASPLYAFIIEA